MTKPIVVSVFIAFALIGLSLWTSLSRGGGLQTVSPAVFAKTLATTEGAVLLDLRTPEEYAQGHYRGARNLNFYAPDFQQKLASLPKDTPYFIYCRSGNRSGKTLQLMRQMGFRRVFDLAGGIAGAGELLPIEK